MKVSAKLPCFLLLLAAALVTSLRAEDPATFKVGAITFTRPAKWEWVPSSSPMRAAQLKVTDAETKTSAEVVFFQFGAGQGGDAKANVDRWLGQFAEPREKLNSKTETVTVGKAKVTYVIAEGTYGGMSGTPTADTGLSGAIIEANDANGSIFIRMTGPKKLVAASLPDFKKMVESGLK